ncbi:MAG: hypothetical protein ABIK22_07810, partial [candidate division WOR-3 bacterium]
VYLYYQGLWTPTYDGIMVAISQDGISNWQYHQVRIAGTEGWRGRPCDPDVIIFGDTFRLYFTGDPAGDMLPETYSAVSRDGINFTLEPGFRFQVSGSPVLDPSLLQTGDTLNYFAGGAPPGENWHAHSTDGLNFTPRPNLIADSLMMANGIRVLGGYRFYCFKNLPRTRSIYSVFSADGENWVLEPGVRLTVDTTTGLEWEYVKDPAIVFHNNRFLMYYVTQRPPLGWNEIKPEIIQPRTILSNPRKGQSAIRSQRQVYDICGNKGGNFLPPGVYFVSSENKPARFQKIVITR